MHYIKQIALCAIIILLTIQSWSQIPFSEKTFGTIYNESCFSFIHTNDNGYAMLGITSSPGTGDQNIYFTKLDSNENIQWTKTYGGPGIDQAGTIRQTLDGGYIICGNQYSFGAGGSDGYLIRTDSQGTMIWSRAYGLPLDDVLWRLELTSDSNYIAMGTTFSSGTNSGDILVVKVNDGGDTLWTRIIGGPVYDAGINLTPADDGGCVIVGRVYSFGAGLRDVMLSRIDGNGNVLWLKTYGGTGTEEGMAVAHTSDNGYIITGATESFSNNTYYDVYMVKTDSAGNMIWSRAYGGDNIDATYCVTEAPDGGYVVAGFTDSWAYLHLLTNNQASPLGDDSSHVFLMKVSILGDTVWTRAFGGAKQDEAYALINDPDGGYFTAAYSASFSGNDSVDAYIIHSDSLGMSDCHTFVIHPHVNNPNTIENSYIPPVSAGLTVTNAATVEDTVTFISSDPCIVISVEENNNVQKPGIIFPNPFSNSATIQLSENTNSLLTLTIRDVLGKTVRTENVYPSNSEIKIERKNLPDGIYFVQINSIEKNIFTGKIILSSKF